MKNSNLKFWYYFFIFVWAMFCLYLLFVYGGVETTQENENQKVVVVDNDCELVETKQLELEPRKLTHMACIEKDAPYFAISNVDREIIHNIVAGEAGHEPMEGKMAVAQCLLNAMDKECMTAEEVRQAYKYSGWMPELKTEHPEAWADVVEAVERVFDNGETVTDENILWFYAPKYSSGAFHQTQTFVGSFGSQKFYCPKK